MPLRWLRRPDSFIIEGNAKRSQWDVPMKDTVEPPVPGGLRDERRIRSVRVRVWRVGLASLCA